MMAEDTDTTAPMEPIPQPRMIVLKIAVVVMGILLVAGFALVAFTIVKRASDPEATAARATPGQFGITDVRIGPGEGVKSFSMNESRIAIHVTGAGGDQIILVHPRTGQEIGRIHLRSATDYAQGAAANAP